MQSFGVVLALCFGSTFAAPKFPVGEPPLPFCNDCFGMQKDIILAVELHENDPSQTEAWIKTKKMAASVFAPLDLDEDKTRVAVIGYNSSDSWVISNFLQAGVMASGVAYKTRVADGLDLIGTSSSYPDIVHRIDGTETTSPVTALMTATSLMSFHLDWVDDATMKHGVFGGQSYVSTLEVGVFGVDTSKSHVVASLPTAPTTPFHAGVASSILPQYGVYTFQVKVEITNPGTEIWPDDIFIGVVTGDVPFPGWAPNAIANVHNSAGYLSDGRAKEGLSTLEEVQRFKFGPSTQKIQKGKYFDTVTIEVDLNNLKMDMIVFDRWEIRRTIQLQGAPKRVVCSIPMGKILGAEVTLITNPNVGFRGLDRPVVVIENQNERKDTNAELNAALALLTSSFNADVYAISVGSPKNQNKFAKLNAGSGTSTTVADDYRDQMTSDIQAIVEGRICGSNLAKSDATAGETCTTDEYGFSAGPGLLFDEGSTSPTTTVTSTVTVTLTTSVTTSGSTTQTSTISTTTGTTTLSTTPTTTSATTPTTTSTTTPTITSTTTLTTTPTTTTQFECDCTVEDAWDKKVCQQVYEGGLCSNNRWKFMCMTTCCAPICTHSPTIASPTNPPITSKPTAAPTSSPTRAPTCPPIAAPPPPPRDACESIDGSKAKLRVLQLIYTGDDFVSHDQGSNRVRIYGNASYLSPVTIVVKSAKSGEMYLTANNVLIGDSLTIAAQRWDSEAVVFIVRQIDSQVSVLGMSASNVAAPPNTISTIYFHTSCSAPIRVGDSFGSIRVVDFSSTSTGYGNNEPGIDYDNSCVICDKQNKDRPRYLRFEWSSQYAANVVANSKKGTLLVSPLNVAPNTNVTIGKTVGEFEFEANTDITVTVTGVGVETKTLHTSCSKPLFVGQTITFSTGVLAIVGFKTQNLVDETICGPSGGCPVQPPPPPPAPCDACVSLDGDKAKIVELVLTYTGLNVLITEQNADDAFVINDAMVTTPVDIVVVDEKNGDLLGEFFNINIGEELIVRPDDKFPASSLIFIVAREDSVSPAAVQMVEILGMGNTGMGDSPGASIPYPPNTISCIVFHTSCSQPLNVGDQYGSIRITGFTNDAQLQRYETDIECRSVSDAYSGIMSFAATGGFSDECDFCDTNERPDTIKLLYTGNWKVDHNQETSKHRGNTLFAPAVKVSVYLPLNFYPTMVIDHIAIGDTFEVDVKSLGADATQISLIVIPATTQDIEARDATNDRTLEAGYIDISCSQPLGVGMSFGSFRIVEIDSATNEFIDCAAETGKEYVGMSECDGCTSASRIKFLSLLYTGDNQIIHSQLSGLHAVRGDARFFSPVRVVISHVASDGRVTYATIKEVSLGHEFSVPVDNDATLGISIYTIQGTSNGNGYEPPANLLLQQIEITTDCYDPIVIGESFGSIEITGFENEEGVIQTRTTASCIIVGSNGNAPVCSNMRSDQFCGAWKAAGLCIRNSSAIFVQSQCAKSCGHCLADDNYDFRSVSVYKCAQLTGLTASYKPLVVNNRVIGCAGSRDLHGKCLPKTSFAEAADSCHAMGARMCTLTELQSKAGYQTGCGLNTKEIWSSTPCVVDDSVGVYVFGGGAKALEDIPPRCAPVLDAVATRCCFDDDISIALESSINKNGGDEASGSSVTLVGMLIGAVATVALIVAAVMLVTKSRSTPLVSNDDASTVFTEEDKDADSVATSEHVHTTLGGIENGQYSTV